MIRALSIVSLATVLLAIVSVPFMILQPGPVIVGGHYHVGPGQALGGDFTFYFAQVTIDEGAAIDGHISLYSSTLDLRGRVTSGIRAFESDLTLREGSQVDGKIDKIDLLHWTILLPATVQFP